MTEYDNRGKVSLWKNASDNPDAPAAKGTVVAHRDIKEGEVLEIALWRNKSDNPNAPMMKGKIQDKQDKVRQPDGESPPSKKPDFDDDIPF